LTAGDAMLIGYARVSTDDQNLDLQRDALRAAGCHKIYEDRMSGAKAARPGLAMVMEVARSGDVLTVWRCQDPFWLENSISIISKSYSEPGWLRISI